MPSFCRHNRLLQNCPICTREQAVEMRPVVSSGAPKVALPRPAGGAGRGNGGDRSTPSTGVRSRPAPSGARRSGTGVRVRRLERGADDGYRSPLVSGLRSSADAQRLAGDLAFASHRLTVLETRPPGLYAEVAGGSDVEERAWLAFLIAYLAPLEDGRDPFAAIAAARVSWASGELPELDGVATGPRTAHDPARGNETLRAYRAWAGRAGSQAAALRGEAGWSPERRFDRAFERLALPGMHRDARFELLVLLGRLGVSELRGRRLHLVGDNDATIAAKRALGIGDAMLLERRAAALAAACAVPLEALDLGFYNWGTGERVRLGLAADEQPDSELLGRCRAALGL
jgi:hypothetical protein